MTVFHPTHIRTALLAITIVWLGLPRSLRADGTESVTTSTPERVAIPIVVEIIQGTRKSEVKFQDSKGQAANAEEMK